MYKLHCLNPISEIGLSKLNEKYQITDNVGVAHGILVRSADMHEMELPDSLLAVARAGAGVNNIPLDKCAEKGIVVFNTPGANANGVKELTIAAMLLAARDIVGGIEWVKNNSDNADIAKLAEKEKKRFAGTELMGKTLGVIGLGAIGAKVANAAIALGMTVYGYKPTLNIPASLNLDASVKRTTDLLEIFDNCDYISLHAPANSSTKGMICAEAIAKMKDNVVILNFARDVLCDEDAIISALETGKIKRYITDFANPKNAGKTGCIVIPHLGASTEESEDNCAVMAVNEIMDYFENGNITNSVNYPSCNMGVCMTEGRIALLHKNIASFIPEITSCITALGVNIIKIHNDSKGEYAYTMIDVDHFIADDILNNLEAMECVYKVRRVK